MPTRKVEIEVFHDSESGQSWINITDWEMTRIESERTRRLTRVIRRAYLETDSDGTNYLVLRALYESNPSSPEQSISLPG